MAWESLLGPVRDSHAMHIGSLTEEQEQEHEQEQEQQIQKQGSSSARASSSDEHEQLQFMVQILTIPQCLHTCPTLREQFSDSLLLLACNSLDVSQLRQRLLGLADTPSVAHAVASILANLVEAVKAAHSSGELTCSPLLQSISKMGIWVSLSYCQCLLHLHTNLGLRDNGKSNDW